jgi:hypothetical protein
MSPASIAPTCPHCAAPLRLIRVLPSHGAAVSVADGFKSVVLEDFLADFVPEIFLWIEFWRVGRQEQQCDVARNREVTTAVVGGSIEDQEDILPGKPS